MLAVIMAAPDPKTRFADAAVLLNYGFGSCSLYVDEDTAPGAPAEVKGGVEEEVSWDTRNPSATWIPAARPWTPWKKNWKSGR